MDVWIGRQLQRLRRESRVTQEQLAGLVWLSPQQIQKYEAGVTRISASKLIALARALNAPISSFFPTDEREVERDGELSRRLERLAPESKMLILALVEALSKASPADGQSTLMD